MTIRADNLKRHDLPFRSRDSPLLRNMIVTQQDGDVETTAPPTVAVKDEDADVKQADIGKETSACSASTNEIVPLRFCSFICRRPKLAFG